MDIGKMFETQKQFDNTFAEMDETTRIKNKFFALIVEQGEAANEAPHTFKYWSSNPKPASIKTAEKFAAYYNQPIKPVEGDPLLEELVDKLHFILSLGNELNLSEGLKYGGGFIFNDDIVDMQIHFTRFVIDLYFLWRNLRTDLSDLEDAKRTYAMILGYFFGIAYALGYSSEALDDAYYKKNKINHLRQKNDY